VTGRAAVAPHSGAESAAGSSPADAPVDFRVISGNPTASELAAVTAVLTATIEDLEGVRRHAEEEHSQTAWQRNQRPIRTPLSRGAGTWRSFTG
jgi:uncharacterized protein (DUF1800 family)